MSAFDPERTWAKPFQCSSFTQYDASIRAVTSGTLPPATYWPIRELRRIHSTVSNNSSYTATAKFLHWLIVALLIAQFVFAWTMPHIGRNTPVTNLISLHFTFGIVVLVVVIARLVWRATHGEPTPLDGIPPWQVQSARVLHWLLYALLFVIPILGWINASWRGMPVVIFGVKLPQLISTRSPGWAWTGDVHGFLSNYALLTLVSLHVVAGLYHYFVRRDGVFQRMLPGG